MSDSTLVPVPNRIADRLVETSGGLSPEQMIARADEALDRFICQWHAAATQAVLRMTGDWQDRSRNGGDLAMMVLHFEVVAADMKCNSEQLGYPGIAAAAENLSKALLSVDSEVGTDEAEVAAALAHLLHCLAEPHRVQPDDRDLLALDQLRSWTRLGHEAWRSNAAE